MAQEELQQGPNTLVIHYRAARTDRTEFRAYLEKDFAAKLRAMKANGELADFRIFYSWYRQPAVREGRAVMCFPCDAAVVPLMGRASCRAKGFRNREYLDVARYVKK